MGYAPPPPTVAPRAAKIRPVPVSDCARTALPVVCCPRLGGGDRHKRPPTHAPRRAGAGVAGGARDHRSGALGLRRRRRAPGRGRARGRLPGRGRLGEVPDRAAARADQRPRARDRERGLRGRPGPGGDDLHRRPAVERIVLGPQRAARPRRPEPARLDPRERLPEAGHARGQGPRDGAAGGRRGGADRTPSPSARCRRARARTSSGASPRSRPAPTPCTTSSRPG